MNNLDTTNFNDDVISFCGSISNGAFAKRRNTCALRSHSIVSLSLRQQTQNHTGKSCHHGSKSNAAYPQETKARFNSCFHHYRIVIAILSGLSMGLMFSLRYNMTISILKMVNQTDLYLKEHPNSTYEDFIEAGYTPGGEFNWNNEIQQLILSTYMISYTLPQVPLSKFGEYIGCRVAVSATLVICSVANLLTPIVAYWGWEWLIVLRMLNGIGGAPIFPLGMSLVEKWMTRDEISLGLTYCQFFQSVLQAVNPLVTGMLCDIHWKYAFYVPGLVCLTFCFMWLFLVTDNPEDNWLVSQQELDKLCGCADLEQGNDQAISDGSAPKEQELKPYSASWSELIRNPTYISYVVIWSIYCCTYCTFTYVIPNYFGQFLKIPVTEVGSFCFVVQIGQLIAMAWPHSFMRLLEGFGNMSKRVSFKMAFSVICIVSIGTWTNLGLFHSIQLVLITLNRSFHASQDVVIIASLMRSFAGSSRLAFSIMNTIGNFTTVILSASVGRWLDYTRRTPFGWTMVFFLFALMHVVGWIIFTTVIHSEFIDLDPKRKERKKELETEKGDHKVDSSDNSKSKADEKQESTKNT